MVSLYYTTYWLETGLTTSTKLIRVLSDISEATLTPANCYCYGPGEKLLIHLQDTMENELYKALVILP